MRFKFWNRQDEIRDKFIEAARKGDFPNYGVFGKRVHILHNKKYNLPSRIGRHSAKPPSPAQRKLAFEEMQKVIKEYCPPGTANPYREIP